MRLDPDDHRGYRLNNPNFLHLYYETHQELFALNFYRPDPDDLSLEAQEMRLALAECHGALRALTFLMTGQESPRAGEFTVPFVKGPIVFN